MRKRMSYFVFSSFLFCSLFVWAQGLTSEDLGKSLINISLPGPIDSADLSPESGQLSSPSIGQKFYEIAYELANSEDVRGTEIEQSILFLTASLKLGNDVDSVYPLLIDFACRETERDYSELVYNLLMDYIDEFADLEVVTKAVEYLLGRLNSREEREKLLEQMLGTLGPKNIVLSSELATRLGLLKAEKADFEAAKFYLMRAYKNNRYNELAFVKLTELMPDQVEPTIYLERLRLALLENPSDIESAIAFAQFAEQLQLYKTAAGAYEYCANLYTYLYPSEALPSRIYLPWAISSYNTLRDRSKCLEIAGRIRQEGRFDLLLEAIAGRAAVKIGNGELATQIFLSVEGKARQLMQSLKQTTGGSEASNINNSQRVSITQYAWFYCFALPVPEKALDWANRAYSVEPNSPTAATILAYALVMNQQTEWAKPLISNYERNQIADLTLAQIQLNEGNKDLAIESLRTAIAKDPGSFAAERAKEILAQQGGEYIPPVDPNAVLTVAENIFGRSLIPVFTPPEQIISVQFSIQGDEFPYGNEFSGVAAIENNSSEPLVISDNSLFKGNIRVDAEISGDLSQKISNLVFTKIRTAFLIEPGRSVLVPLRLYTGELRNTLLTYPQASLDIKFTLYLDPVTTDLGKVANRLTQIEPSTVHITRPGEELTRKYLISRFNSISEGQLVQKIQTAQLFIGLLMEQHAMSNRKPPYRFVYADWSVLRSALTHESGLLRNPAEREWVVKVHTMAEMLSLPLDYQLINAMAENLNHDKWPVRMMAIYLLAKNPGGKFDKVLEWVAQYDSSVLVRDMANILGRSTSEQHL